MNLDPHCREKGLHGPHRFDTGAWGPRECEGTEVRPRVVPPQTSWCAEIETHAEHTWEIPGHGQATCPGRLVRPDRQPRMATRPGTVKSEHILEALREAGIVGQDDQPTRVIIDLRTGHVPVIHIEKVGDERMLRLVRTLDEVRIERAPVDVQPAAELPDPAVYMRSRGA